VSDDYPAIGDYGFISDCHSLALIGRDASIEWACFHRFDGGPVFARILDRELGGFFRIAPAGPFEASHRYIGDTNVLETTFTTATGIVTVTDCLPAHEDPDRPRRVSRRAPSHLLVRVVQGIEGSVEMALEFSPRFDYGMTTPYLRLVEEDLALVTGGADALLLQSDVGPLERDLRGGATAQVTVSAGDEAYVALTWAESAELEVTRLSHNDLRSRVDETVGFWTQWSSRCTYEGPYRDAVLRSALVLKGLTYSATGAVIAAATTSLPEEIGGVRNWDYRYAWLRDSVGLLVNLARVGYLEEAEDFADWMMRTTAGRADELQIMYGIGGERLLHEFDLDHLDGYRGSKPVRVGNGAWDQFQLDTYGEIIAAAWYLAVERMARQRERERQPIMVDFARDVVLAVVEKWQEPDEGIWEVRGERQHFTFSKLMAWVALERGIQLADIIVHPDLAQLEDLAHVRDQIRKRIEEEAVDPETGSFTQAFGSRNLDASTLQIPMQGFVPFDDPRVLATIDRIDSELSNNGMVYRYLDEGDGLPGGEGTFVICTLWLVVAMALSGQVERAEERFGQVLSHASDLGLLAEEIDPDTGEQLGNFPQAFSHMGVIAAALAIEEARSMDPSGDRGPAPR